MSVRKRGNRYQVVYRCLGEASPRTETFKTEDEAVIRDRSIKMAKANGTFEPPARLSKGVVQQTKDITVSEFLDEYIQVIRQVAEMYGIRADCHGMAVSLLHRQKHRIKPHIRDPTELL